MADKYSSLENHYREKSIEIARFKGYMSNYLPWVAREKLHGANFSFAGHLNEYQGISWDFHTRRTQITLEDSFHGFQSVYERIVDNLNRAYYFTLGFNTFAYEVQIFGELVGPTISKGLKVDYGPKTDFFVFDIKVFGPGGAEGLYLADHQVETICSLAKLKMAPKLGFGKFDDLAKLPREFESVVLDHSTPYTGVYHQFSPKKNPAEGFVLKPDTPQFMPNGSRVAYKFKSDRFAEKELNKIKKEAPAMSELDQGVLNLMLQYVNESRLDNVMSKEVFTQKDFGKAQGMFAKDALEDIAKDMVDNPIVFDDKKSVMKMFQAEIANLLRKYWTANF